MSRVHFDDYSWTFIFELKNKCKGFFLKTWFHVRPVTSVCFNTGLAYLTFVFVTIRRCVEYTHNYIIDKNIVLQDVVQSLTMQGDVFRHKKEVHVMRPGFQNVMTFISLQKRTDVRIMLFI